MLRAGGMIDIPTVGEIRAEIAAGLGAEIGQLREETAAGLGQLRDDVGDRMAQLVALQRDQARAVKWLRFPRLRGTVINSAISLGGQGQPVGPEPGYLWSVRRLVITGLTESPTSPDIVNLFYTDNTAGPVWWQLNGNSFGSEFDMGGMMLRGGETLNVVSVGTVAATGTVIVDWDGWEVPEDQAAKLIYG